MLASWAFEKWNSELARVFRATIFKCKLVSRFSHGFKFETSDGDDRLLTFTALLLSDAASALKVVQSEDVVDLRLGVHDGAVSVLDALLNLTHEEALNVVWLLVAKQGGQVL